jgi:site-specific DNA recombinase
VNCAIYARKSTAQTDREGDEKSVGRQITNARAFAVSKGWRVDDTHIYSDDAVSGAEVTKLRQKQRMLELVGSGAAPFSAIVMQSNDRLSRRDGDEAVAEMKEIARAGIEVWFYSDNTKFEYGTFSTNVVSYLRAEVAAEYRRAIAAKTAEAMRRKAEQGHVTGGRVFGYDFIDVIHGRRVRRPPEQKERHPNASHVERTINDTEAVIVRRVYEMYAAGAGLPTIAHTLNADGAPRPRAQQGRVAGWCGSSIREILKRPLYRGEIVFGRIKKRDLEGVVNPVRRSEAEWLRVSKPELRIIPPQLADAVDARFAGHQQRALRLRDGRLLGRPPGAGSPYLLVGMLRCGLCGGSMEVLSRSNSKRGSRTYDYRCCNRRRKGEAICRNNVPARMIETDDAVLRAIEETILHPAVIERALAHAEAMIANERMVDQRAALEAELLDIDRAANRLTRSIASSDVELAPLVAALEVQERRRKEVQARLQELRTPRPTLDARAIRSTLEGYLVDWKGLLRGHVQQAQQIIRRLVVGRLTMTPQPAGYYTFTGSGTVRPLLSGCIRNMASPPGFEPGFQP